MTWAEDEFGGADLGDKRLNKRLVLLAERLGEQPSASIPEACRGAAEMHAAYRFLGREAVDWRELMQPHWDASARRMQSHPVVLCIQDTTELDFEGKSAQGLGPLSYEAQRQDVAAIVVSVDSDPPQRILDHFLLAGDVVPVARGVAVRVGERDEPALLVVVRALCRLPQRIDDAKQQLRAVDDWFGSLAELHGRLPALLHPNDETFLEAA